MPFKQLHSGVELPPSVVHFLNPVSNDVIFNCVSKYYMFKLIPFYKDQTHDMSWICDKPLLVTAISTVQMSGGGNNNENRFSNVSPNVENDHFMNIDNRHQHNQDHDEQDSGFGSGGFKDDLVSCQEDHETLLFNERLLSACGFYYPNLDSGGAMKKLKFSSVGTFLIRNSLDSKFLFSLSVKTQRGATSVRIAYQKGWFSFDCDERIRNRMPRFHSVLELVDHYVELSRQGRDNSWRWEEKSGRKNMVVEISKPCRTSVPSLLHLSTIAVNQQRRIVHNLIADDSYRQDKVLKCIGKYPFKV